MGSHERFIGLLLLVLDRGRRRYGRRESRGRVFVGPLSSQGPA